MSDSSNTKVKRRKAGAVQIPMGGRGDAGPLAGLTGLIHITAAGAAREIVADQAIGVRRCSVFGRELVYFFLGRPAYRLRDGDQKSRHISMFPVAFVADATVLGPPHHVYPVDTGALMSGVFGERPDPHVFLEDYELAPDLADAHSHIHWAFGGLDEYLQGDLRPALAGSLPAFDEVGNAFLHLASLGSRQTSNQPDMRASSVEVAYDQPTPLRSAVGFAVFPKQYLQDKGAKNAPFIADLDALGVAWETYDWQPNLRPDDFADDITRLVTAYLKRPRKA